MKVVRHPLVITLTLLALAVATITSCQKELSFDGSEPEASHSMTVNFKAVVDGDPLVPGNTYTNFWGEDYAVSAFKFYIAQVKLMNTDSGTSYDVNKDEYFLVNFAGGQSTRLLLKAVPYKYNHISFVLGVDSIRNVSGAQTGALDPANGMFWTWNSGYIMAKLEGTSPSSSQPNQAFEYHIGGFSGPDNVLRRITLPFPSGDVALQPAKSSEVTITANANAWFFNPNDIEISTTPVCTTPGPLARQIMENYIKMFTVTSVVTQ